MIVSRETKYSTAIVSALGDLGHATNSELLLQLRDAFPEVSATTVHRATARLLERNKISEAPADAHGSMRYDATVTPHDHFICSGCGGIRDIDIADAIIPTVSQALGGCKITGRLVINGSCETCLKGETSV